MNQLLNDKFKNGLLPLKDFFIKYYNWLLILSVILILSSGYLLLLKPKYNSITKAINDNKVLRSVMQENYIDRENYFNELTKLVDTYKSYAIGPEDIKRMNFILPAEKGDYIDTTNLLASIESLIKTSGLILNSLDVSYAKEIEKLPPFPSAPAANSPAPADENTLKDINKISINASVMGANYNGLKNLLNLIENNLRLIDINDINFSMDSETVSLRMSAYYMDSGANK